MGQDGHSTVGRDGNEDLGIDHGAVRHLVGAGLIGREGLTRHHGRGEHQPAGNAESLEDGAPRDFFDLDAIFNAAKAIWRCDDVHDQTPVDARWTAFSIRW